MLDSASAPAALRPAAQPRPAEQPRARGAARIHVKTGPRGSALGGLRQSGSMRVLFPRGAIGVEAVLLNTAGGVTGGDRFEIAGRADPGAELTLTTQAAERAYRAQPHEMGRIDARLAAGPGARLHWLPQETILFEGSALTRRLSIDLDGDAAFLGVEALAFGRAAMGERLNDLRFSDQWRLRRDGRLVFAEAFRLSGDAAAALAGPATGAGAGAAATLVFSAPGAEDALPGAREIIGADGGASLVQGVLVARLLGEDAFALRRRLIPLIARLRGAPPPKVWSI